MENETEIIIFTTRKHHDKFLKNTSMKELKGKKVLLTGGSRGIGPNVKETTFPMNTMVCAEPGIK